MQHSARYVILFALAVCGVCSIFVASSAVLLKDRQERNKALDIQKKVLAVAGLMTPNERIAGDEVRRRFEKNVRPEVIDLVSGERAEDVDPASFDPRSESKGAETSRPAAPNAAKVLRVPKRALVYRVVQDGRLRSIILPVEGKGLWSTLYGFLALNPDGRTIEGLTFYQHGETPGLGGEVDNPRWKALWKGRKAFDDRWQPAIAVKKGRAGPPDVDPYAVDGLSGATITSRGVTNLLAFWLGDEGFGPYLARLRDERGI
jgi:Na+-transporting NADH:ubiquinone oxidoreductase subunit C